MAAPDELIVSALSGAMAAPDERVATAGEDDGVRATAFGGEIGESPEMQLPSLLEDDGLETSETADEGLKLAGTG